MTQPGWAMPINAPATQPLHWWRTDGRKACSPDDILSYTGPKIATPDEHHDVCSSCADAVEQAFLIVGTSQ